MTLIASHISKYGIVLASDSNLTSRQGNSGFGQKVFPIPYLNAGISYSGLYNIGGTDVDDWMNEHIRNESFLTNSIEEFVTNLTSRLNTEYEEKAKVAAIMHVCGYSKVDFKSHCEHWHISNSSLQSGTGNYSINEHFVAHCDFNTRTSIEQREILKKLDLHPNNHQLFVNGFPPARASFMTIKKVLEGLLTEITKKEDWDFRPPKNIFEVANYLKMYFNIVGELFKMSDHDALFVGGETQVHLIPAPPDLDKD